MIGDLVPRSGAEVSTARHDPRDDWPEEARRLREALVEAFGPDDPLPDVAGAWVSRQRSRNTRRPYARNLLGWALYAQTTGVHPLQARLPLADAYSCRLATMPKLQRVKGGRPGETAPGETPLGDAARAQALSSCASFYRYAMRVGAAEINPFDGVTRPYIDPDYSPTMDIAQEESAALIETARGYSPRSYALTTGLYTLGPRIDSLLSPNVEDLGYERGYPTLPLVLKGNKLQRVPLTPLYHHALMTYLGGRTTGPLYITSSGRRWTETEVWKHLRVLARKAGIPQAGTIHPHMLRGAYITDSLDEGAPLQEVQDSVGHGSPRTTQRYNKRRRRLENHPTHILSRSLAQRLSPEGEDETR